MCNDEEMTKRTRCTEGLVFRRRYAKRRSAAALQNTSEERTDGITAIPRLRESAQCIAALGNAKRPGVSFRNSNLDIISSFVLRRSNCSRLIA